MLRCSVSMKVAKDTDKIKTCSPREKKSDTWSQKNTTHFISVCSASFYFCVNVESCEVVLSRLRKGFHVSINRNLILIDGG